MSQSLSEVYLHIIFSTKLRQALLHDREICERLHAYLAGTCNKLGCPSFQIGGIANHVHIGCRLGKSITLQDLLKELKRVSSQWVKQQAADLANFYWQTGYAVFSVSPSRISELKKYIQGQEEHHRGESFQDEVRRLCQIYGAPLDERYAWD